ncbi:MAG: hypothetical protein CL846_02835 [Crocinitomicaceae bacterium]|nr:hypothetical protein [Crocinitomicaceae bacterium]|tara:strand:+ start:8922 stop:9164 length:243 start_codon:yes stop_codon:yes gene_type:complete
MENSLESIASLAKFRNKPISSTNLSNQKKEYNFKSIPVFAIPHPSGSSRGFAKNFLKLHNKVYNSKTYLTNVLNLIENYL